LNFLNPLEVSKERIWDSIDVDFKNPKDKFRGSDSFKTFDIKSEKGPSLRKLKSTSLSDLKSQS